ncbi:MAG: CPBP family intramembrane glutamic endopeptidase [Verrucomicrobiota bacterium]
MRSNRPLKVAEPKKNEGIVSDLSHFLLILTPFLAFVFISDFWMWLLPFIAMLVIYQWRLGGRFRAEAVFWGIFSLLVIFRVTWPLMFVLPIFVGAVLHFYALKKYRFMSWATWGKPTKKSLSTAAAICFLSSLGLLVWFYTVNPDVSGITKLLPEKMSIVAFIGFSILFSLANAIWEEFLLKGFTWSSLSLVCASPVKINLIQSFLFGLVHYQGFPSGLSGVILASIYGYMLGILRQRSDGMGELILTHFVADMIICILVFTQI